MTSNILEGFHNREVPEAARRHALPPGLLTRDKESTMRLDHVMASGDVVVLGARVVDDADAEASSEHRPVYDDLRFTPRPAAA
jgi:endonuclease/exonuclease/phosphatase family metal-dependent hydrolase